MEAVASALDAAGPYDRTEPAPHPHVRAAWTVRLARTLRRANAELWLLLGLFVLAALLNYAALSHRAVLNLFTLPVVASAFLFGRRHATLTALGSLLLVVLLGQSNAELGLRLGGALSWDVWFEFVAWGGGLMVTAYFMGVLYEHRNAQIRELRETYHGVLLILRHFLANDAYTENHCYRVSVYAKMIAAEIGLSAAETEDIRAAALLHDIGKLKVSRDLLHKAASLTREEFGKVQQHVEHSADLLEPAGGALGRVLPIVLAHHDRYDGSGYTGRSGAGIPIGARVVAVADAYDAIVSDRPYRKGSAAFEAREMIEQRSGRDFDPTVVQAFVRLVGRGEFELTSVIV